MKVTAINGSPRKNWNTGTLLSKVLEGAASQNAETELINLYRLANTILLPDLQMQLRLSKS